MNAAKHILVVEDEEHLAVGIKYNLEAEHYRVTTVGDGRAALEVIDSQPGGVDLVVLDLMLPGMSGYAVCKSIRASGHDMPVLVLSARTLAEDRTRGFEAGANQYMMKPFDLDEFLSRVKNLLAQLDRSNKEGQHARPPVRRLEFGDAHVNFDTFEVTVAEKKVRMTKQELKLLEYFAANSGRVIPRHELLENVWEMPGHLSTRAVDQFIRRLRKTFESEPAHPRYFLTVRDVGYRFVPKPDEKAP